VSDSSRTSGASASRALRVDGPPRAGADGGRQALLVALDVDGTIVDHDLTLTPRVGAAVRAVADAGHHVVVATGRTVTATLPVLAELELDSGYLVCSNGAVTARLDPALPGGLELVDVVTFDPAPAMALLREELPTAAFAVEVPGEGILVAGDFPDGELRSVAFEELTGLAATRVVVRSLEHTPQHFLDLTRRIGLKGVSYAVGWTAWLDLAPEGVTKASALEVVRQRLGVPLGATIAVGDGRNDLEMLAWAGRSVAMGQGPPEVLEAAGEVARPVGEDGLADVLEGLLAPPDPRT
jgi:hydroxymethylpyrimidine pyrophosphatase-like HAD family hydrolase